MSTTQKTERQIKLEELVAAHGEIVRTAAERDGTKMKSLLDAAYGKDGALVDGADTAAIDEQAGKIAAAAAKRKQRTEGDGGTTPKKKKVAKKPASTDSDGTTPKKKSAKKKEHTPVFARTSVKVALMVLLALASAIVGRWTKSGGAPVKDEAAAAKVEALQAEVEALKGKLAASADPQLAQRFAFASKSNNSYADANDLFSDPRFGDEWGKLSEEFRKAYVEAVNRAKEAADAENALVNPSSETSPPIQQQDAGPVLDSSAAWQFDESGRLQNHGLSA